MAEPLNYQLVRSRKRKKTITLQLKHDGKIVIYAPHHTSRNEIDTFFTEKSSWLQKKLIEREGQAEKADTPKEFVSGEKFLYLGEGYPLEIQDTNSRKTPLRLSYGVFILDKDRVDKARELFLKWYREKAREAIVERVGYWSKKLQLFPVDMRITNARSRYGSCSPQNTLSFSWRIIMAPYTVIDYVVVHELVHIKEKNHARRFWSYLETIIPDYKRRKLWLKENAHLLRM